MIRYLILLLLGSICVSCEKELDFDYHDVDSQLVIEGFLTRKGSEVKLSYTVPMNEPLTSKTIIEAEVILTDITDNISYTLIPVNGVFRSQIPGIPNHTYELSVNHKGRDFKSNCLMRDGVEILDLKFQWIKMPYDHVAVLEIVSTVSEIQGSCYWTRIYKNGEPYKWLMSHGSGAVDGVLTQTTFTTRQNPDDEDDKDNLEDGDVLTVKVLPISLEMYDYLVGITSDSNGPSMFEGYFCLGYFLASETSESKITFHPSQIPYYPL